MKTVKIHRPVSIELCLIEYDANTPAIDIKFTISFGNSTGVFSYAKSVWFLETEIIIFAENILHNMKRNKSSILNGISRDFQMIISPKPTEYYFKISINDMYAHGCNLGIGLLSFPI